MNLLNFLIILTSVNNCLCSQFYEDKHHFDDNNISHLGRFFSINGNIQINLEIDIFDDFINPSITRLIKNIPLKFILIDYEKYIAVNSLISNDEKSKCNKLLNNALFIKPINLFFSKGKRTILNKKEVKNNNKPTMWYFILIDCDFHSHKMMPDFPFIITNLVVKDDLESHFSYEEKYILQFLIIIIIIYFIILALYCYKIVKIFQNDDLNFHSFLCIFSLIFKFFYLFFKSIHLYIYSINGTGIYIFDIFSLLSWSFSQFIISCVLIFTIAGWGIIYRSLVDYDNLYPTMIIIFIIQSICMVLFHYNEDSMEKFHDFDGYVGYLIILSKAFLLILMIYLLNQIIHKINNSYSSNQKLKDFYFNVAIIGSIYTMSFPFLFVLVCYIDYFNRHKVIVVGDILIQIFNLLILLRIFNNKDNAFREYSMYTAPIPKILKSKVNSCNNN